MAKAEWRGIPGWDDLYEVSDDGRVRSKGRRIVVLNPHGVLAAREYRGRELRLFITGSYPSVKLSRPGQKPVTFYVHEAVAAAFLGPRPAGTEICHYNDVPEDNRLENLRYDTRAANAQDAVRNRRQRRGE